MNSRKFWMLLILMFCFSVSALPQDQPPPPPVPARTCTGSPELSFVSTTGNTDTQTLGLGGSIECKPNKWTYLAKGKFIRSEADDIETAKSLDTLFRASRDLTPHLKAYGQFNYFQNELQELKTATQWKVVWLICF